MESGDQFIKEVTGSYLVYPGHPLVLATVIMKAFDSLDKAAENVDGVFAAQMDRRVPGSADSIRLALCCLKLGETGRKPAEMINAAENIWKRNMGLGNQEQIKQGSAQAELIEAKFIELASRWLSPKRILAPSY